MQTREKIINITWQLLQAVGYTDTTTKLISQQSNVSESTLFRLFGDKKSLMQEVICRFKPSPSQIILSDTGDLEPLFDQLTGLLLQYMQVYRQFLPLLRIRLHTEEAAGHEEGLPDVSLRAFSAPFAGYLERLSEAGKIRVLDFQLVADMVFARLLTKMQQLADGEGKYDDQAAKEFAHAFGLFLEKMLRPVVQNNNTMVFQELKENKLADVRENNLRLILQYFMESDKLVISDLIKAIDLSKTTIMRLVNQLIDDGLVIELGVDASSTEERGRPPSSYCFRADCGYCINARFRSNRALIVTMSDLQNKLLHVVSKSIEPQISFEDAMELICKCVNELLEMQAATYDKVAGICVSSVGPTDLKHGSIMFSPRFENWQENAEVKTELYRHIPENIPVYIYNEMTYQAIGELYFGKARGKQSALVLEAGEKLGSGVIVDGKLMIGAHSLAGEIGHITLDVHSSIQCVCGAYGCFRALVSAEHAYELYCQYNAECGTPLTAEQQKSLHMEDILDASLLKEEAAVRTLEELAKWFGLAFANLVLLLDPEIIVIQGIYTGGGEWFLERIRHHMAEGRFPLIRKAAPKLEYSTLGSDAAMLGAGKLVADAFVKRYTGYGEVSEL